MRWLPLLLVACTTQPPSGPLETSVVFDRTLPNDAQPQIDVLLVLDDSAGIANVHLDAAAVADRLFSLPSGLPDLRIGVLTADPADGGAFRGHVLALSEDYFGTRTQSFVGSLADALAPQLVVGTSGGAPHLLEMARRALDTHPDFHRPNASLLVAMVTSADDGSPNALDSYLDAYRLSYAIVAPDGVPRLTALLGGSSPIPLERANDVLAAAQVSQRSLGYLFCEPVGLVDCVASDSIDGVEIAAVPACADEPDARHCFELLAPGYCSHELTGPIELRIRRKAMAPPGTTTRIECVQQ